MHCLCMYSMMYHISKKIPGIYWWKHIHACEGKKGVWCLRMFWFCLVDELVSRRVVLVNGCAPLHHLSCLIQKSLASNVASHMRVFHNSLNVIWSLGWAIWWMVCITWNWDCLTKCILSNAWSGRVNVLHSHYLRSPKDQITFENLVYSL